MEELKTGRWVHDVELGNRSSIRLPGPASTAAHVAWVMTCYAAQQTRNQQPFSGMFQSDPVIRKLFWKLVGEIE